MSEEFYPTFPNIGLLLSSSAANFNPQFWPLKATVKSQLLTVIITECMGARASTGITAKAPTTNIEWESNESKV